MEHSLHGGPLAKQLLACIRLVVATQEEVQKVVDGTVNPLEGPLSKACEMQALETLLVVLKDLLAPVQEGLANVEEMMVARQGPAGNGSSVERNENGFDSSWQTSLGFCKAYLEGQQRVLRLSMEQCQKLIAAEL